MRSSNAVSTWSTSLGDLVATCVSPQSRNRHAGEQLGLDLPTTRTIHDVVTCRIRATDAYRGLTRRFRPITSPTRLSTATRPSVQGLITTSTRTVSPTASAAPPAVAGLDAAVRRGRPATAALPGNGTSVTR